jgi:hypothetical protein
MSSLRWLVEKDVINLQKYFIILFYPNALYEGNSDEANLDYLGLT